MVGAWGFIPQGHGFNFHPVSAQATNKLWKNTNFLPLTYLTQHHENIGLWLGVSHVNAFKHIRIFCYYTWCYWLSCSWFWYKICSVICYTIACLTDPNPPCGEEVLWWALSRCLCVPHMQNNHVLVWCIPNSCMITFYSLNFTNEIFWPVMHIKAL